MDKAPHLLVVDDDPRLLHLLRRFLCEQGFRVTAVPDAAQARATLGSVAFDLLVVDVMMPGEDGMTLTRDLRARAVGGRVPILLLTARGEAEDRIAGLEAGADDYLTKPFEPRELVLRVRAILARAQQPELPSAPAARLIPLRLGVCVFDPSRDLLTREGQPVRLTAAEASLLKALAAAEGAAVSREDLAGRGGLDGNPRSVDVQVTRLRKKIEPDPRVPRYLQTVRGAGYALRPE